MKKSIKRIQCVLTKPLRGKGGIGEVVSVKRGYARYLERFDKATRATKEVLETLYIKKEEWSKMDEIHNQAAEITLAKLAKFEKIILNKRVSHASTLYSSVKQDEIIKFFESHDIKLSKDNIKIDRVIKTLGEHFIMINVYGNYVHNLIVEVCKEDF